MISSKLDLSVLPQAQLVSCLDQHLILEPTKVLNILDHNLILF